VKSCFVRNTAARRATADFPVRWLCRAFATVGLASSAVLYSAWVLQFPLRLGTDPVRAYASELAATNGPDHRLFLLTDLTAGLLAAAAAMVMLLTGQPRSLPLRVAWAGVASFGAATAVDSLLPLPCAPHLDRGCAVRPAGHQLPITDALHTVTSSAAIVGLLVAIVCFTMCTRHGTLAHHIGAAITIVSVTSTVWTIAEVVLDDTSPSREQVGLAQRIQLIALAGAVAYTAWRSWTSAQDAPVTPSAAKAHRRNDFHDGCVPRVVDGGRGGPFRWKGRRALAAPRNPRSYL
jgi:Protein of unknown function (DUF998)